MARSRGTPAAATPGMVHQTLRRLEAAGRVERRDVKGRLEWRAAGTPTPVLMARATAA